MEVVLSGVMPQQNGLNKCYVENCPNDACTVMRKPDQFNICALHLKEKLESGEWTIAAKKTCQAKVSQESENETTQCSELFARVFDAHVGLVSSECVCGRVHFDQSNPGFFEKGDLEFLLQRQKDYPDQFFGVDHSIGIIEINEIQIVEGCCCEYAKKYEDFILKNAEKIAEYLREYSKKLKEEAEKLSL